MFTPKIHVTLTFDQLNPPKKNNRSFKFNKGNPPIKFEGSAPNATTVIIRKRSIADELTGQVERDIIRGTAFENYNVDVYDDNDYL